MRLTYWTGFWVFLLDQLSKYIVLYRIDLPTQPNGTYDVFPPFLVFRMAWNRGVNFGLFANFDMRWALVAVALAISAFVLWWIRKQPANRWAYVSAGLLVGGALGNVVDRVLHGAVADFINMSCCGITNPYAFNIADISIFLGAVGLVFFTDGDKSDKTA
ncbi:signal peptidase II [Thalassorhabdomicrobium marinisediminis]|uniref:Lipoprotein signal peptidase n=1 Tax=Thalassorhabdomicrobium marinisediminis TaxID=2170577 RepID=A0A2T7G0C9_9RHOB|nr:signal peptidase II [Thalassorhabdomicrobium marinisediminis]PVA07867.1 signal peptidase II [Thalassorhabdomicrobium marinisediminis]